MANDAKVEVMDVVKVSKQLSFKNQKLCFKHGLDFRVVQALHLLSILKL